MNPMTDPIKYIAVRIDNLLEERAKNDSSDTHMIIDKSIAELSIVLDLLKRNKQLSMSPYS